MKLGWRVRLSWLALLGLLVPGLRGAEIFRVATYNVENYLDEATETRFVKSAAARAKVCENIFAMKPDVIALEEMGSASALRELQGCLKARGLDLPESELVSGSDTNVHVAVLSRFPITARRPHVTESFLLSGKRFRVSRGFAEVEIQVSPGYSFTLVVAHLKSKRPVPQADEGELRVEEAKILREIIDARLAAKPGLNLVVLGDFNDSKDSVSTRQIVGKGKFKLVDTRPAERNGDKADSSGTESRNVAWTHYYGKEDTYSRIDFLLLSPGMAKEWLPAETYVLAVPEWGVASDHRPVVAGFKAEDL